MEPELPELQGVVAGPLAPPELEHPELQLLAQPQLLAPELEEVVAGPPLPRELLQERLPALHQDELVLVAEVVDLAAERRCLSPDCWAK